MSQSDSDVDEQPTPPNEYVVEAIRKSRRINGKFHYYVKWKNYPESECSWEPEENCLHCGDLISEFKAGNTRTRGTRTRAASKGNEKNQPSKAKKSRVHASADEEDTEADGASRDLADKFADAALESVEDMSPKNLRTSIDEEDNPPSNAHSIAPTEKPSTSNAVIAVENAGSETNRDSSYLINAGEELEKIIKISDIQGQELMATVKYKSGKEEAVPTRLLMDLYAKPLAMFYETKFKP